MSNVVHTAPPSILPGVDQEDGGKCFSALMFLEDRPIAGAVLTKIPDCCADMRQVMKDFSETIKAGEDLQMVDYRIHKLSAGYHMRRVRDYKLRHPEAAAKAMRDLEIDPDKVQCVAAWTMHVKHTDDLNGPCLMHMRIVAPWLVGSVDDLPVYFEEMAGVIEDVFRNRPCWNDTFDLQDVMMDLVRRRDLTYSVEEVK